MTTLSKQSLRLIKVDKKAMSFKESVARFISTLNDVAVVDSYKEILHTALEARRIEILNERYGMRKKPFVNCFGIVINGKEET